MDTPEVVTGELVTSRTTITPYGAPTTPASPVPAWKLPPGC